MKRLASAQLLGILLSTFSAMAKDEVKFPVVKAILGDSKYECLKCHNWQNWSEKDFIRNEMIIPGYPDISPLIVNLKNNGGKMPKDKTVSLSDTEVSQLRKWIESAKPLKDDELDHSLDFSKNKEAKLFLKCYAHIVRDVPASTDPVFKEVISGKISGVNGCKKVINIATLDKDGMLAKDSENKTDILARKIFKTFNNIHRSWFPSDNFSLAIDTGESFIGTRELYYPGEMALHLTRALFQPNVKFSETVTSPATYELIRSNPADYKYSVAAGSLGVVKDQTLDENKISYYIDSKTNGRVDAVLIQKGEVEGIKEITGSTIPAFNKNPNSPIEYRTSFGGGLLGARPYLLLNNGRSREQTSDGGIKQYRRWGKEFFQNVLCRDIPVVRSKDAIKFVDKSSSLPFRNGISCMQCHSSADRVSQIHRNKVITTSTGTGQTFATALIRSFTPNLPQEDSLPIHPDKDFYLRPPQGTFYFRDYRGDLHDEAIMGTEGLGKVVSELDDYYICTAKKYYHYFTGINVPLFDPGDLGSPKITEQEMSQQKRVIQLGLELKKSQSLKDLIFNIINSPEYKNK